MPLDLLSELRSATRDVHERLERHLDVPTRCLALPSYTEMLVGMHSVYAPLERGLASWPGTPDVIPDWAARRKCAWLEADLASLGAPQRPEVATPPVATAEDVVGVMYVMEGATLGAAVILQHLSAAPHVPAHRFFAGYGSERIPMWRAFRGHVAAVDRDSLRIERVVAAARATFAAVEHACADSVPVP